MKEGDIVVVNTKTEVLIHARLKQPLMSGWIVELVCEKGVERMRESGHPAFTGYSIWAHSDSIGYEYNHYGTGSVSCDKRCVLEEEAELCKTYGGD